MITGAMKFMMVDEIIERIAEQNGVTKVCCLATEEMSELTKALQKKTRIMLNDKTCQDTEKEVDENIVEEIADVEFCLQQLKCLLGIQTEVFKTKVNKVKRTEKRMKEERHAD